jgi:fatty acid desaturase
MGMFSWFTSAPKAIDNVLDKDNGLFSQVGGWINELNLTEEERLNANAKTVDSVQQFAIATMDENSERSKSRRELAHLYIKFYLLWLSVGFGVWPINENYAIFLITALTGLALGGAFTSIMIFHFGSHGLAKLKRNKVTT